MAMLKIHPSSVSFQSSGADSVMPIVGHRKIEYAEGVGLADAKMDAERRRRNEPAAEAGLGDCVCAVEPAYKAQKSR